MPFHIVQNDLTRMETDAIVNAANTMLAGGGGVCGAIFRAAGWDEMQAACDKLAPIEVGGAAVTPAFGLPQKYVIHAVGPVWQGGRSGEKELLYSAYRSALGEAERLGLSSIAFPLISAGIFGYPKSEALSVAMDAARDFLMERDEREMDIYLVVLDPDAVSIGSKLFGDIHRYLEDYDFYPEYSRRARRREYESFEEHLKQQELAAKKLAGIKTQLPRQGSGAHFSPAAPAFSEEPCLSMPLEEQEFMPECAFCESAPAPVSDGAVSLDDLLGGMKSESFAERLFRFIDEKKLTDPQVYKAANLDRRLFSKIRSHGADYKPNKNTAIALAIGAGLDYDEAQELLGTAGFVLSRSSKSDTIVRYFLENGIHDIFRIEATLYEYGEPALSAVK